VLDAEFRDPRLIEVYDAEFPGSPEDDVVLSLVDETPAARVLDLGCGSGRLTVALAAAGHRVTGIDPAGAALDRARRRAGGERVRWVEGTSADAPDDAFDVAVMTAHVAQVFVTPAEWGATLADLKRALVRGGRLIFDSRDPAARAWERWNPVDARQDVTLPDGRVVTVTTEVTAVRGGAVSFRRHYTFPDGLTLHSDSTLGFRSEEVVRASLATAGFVVERVDGGWDREPVGAGDGELVVLARA